MGNFGLLEASSTRFQALDHGARRLDLRSSLCASPARRKRHCFGERRIFPLGPRELVNKIVKVDELFLAHIHCPRAPKSRVPIARLGASPSARPSSTGRARSTAGGPGRGSSPCEVNDSFVSRAAAASARQRLVRLVRFAPWSRRTDKRNDVRRVLVGVRQRPTPASAEAQLVCSQAQTLPSPPPWHSQVLSSYRHENPAGSVAQLVPWSGEELGQSDSPPHAQ